MKTLVTSIAVLIMSSTVAFADNCDAPELELEIEQDFDNSRGYDTETSISFGISWKLGDKTECRRRNALETDLLRREIINEANETAKLEAEIITEQEDARKKAAEAREKDAKAAQEEVELLSDKIELCSDFEKDTAPASIVTFCGDLLQ